MQTWTLPNADEMLVKARLAARIGETIKRCGLTQVQVSGILGMPQPRLSNMLRGRFRVVSEAKMLELLTKLGRDVKIVVKPAPRSRETGHLSVVFT